MAASRYGLSNRRPPHIRRATPWFNLSLHPPSRPLSPSLFTVAMEHTAQTASFDPFFDLPAQSRGTSSSIWAPQPQPSETAWSKAIDSFTRVNSIGISTRPDARRASSFPSVHGNEDVFGPVGLNGHLRKNVGAIGDGRKKGSPTFDEIVRVDFGACMRRYSLVFVSLARRTAFANAEPPLTCSIPTCWSHRRPSLLADVARSVTRLQLVRPFDADRL